MKKKWYKLLTICMVLCLSLSMVQTVMSDDCEHSWNSNGICESCGLECEHESKTWKSTGESEHSLICNICDISFDKEWCTFDSNGACEKQCGNIESNNEGCHHDQYEYYYEDMNDGTHAKRCWNCTEILLKEEHNFIDNECNICGAVKCYHDSEKYRYESSDDESYMHWVICADCDTPLWLDQCDYNDSNICKLCHEPNPDVVESCQHTGYTFWRYDKETQTHSFICNDCYEILESTEDHSLTEWNPIGSEEHYRMCTLGCEYHESEDHKFEENGYKCTVCGYISEARKDEILASFRSDAKEDVEEAFDEYSKKYDVYGSQMVELYESTMYSIDQAQDKDTLDQIVTDAREALPEAALNDVKTEAYNAIGAIVDSQKRSEEFYNCVSDWIYEISYCENIESVKDDLKDIVENKIPECEEKYGYVDPEALCKGEKTISPEEGTYELYLDGTNAGYFTFTAVYGGWAIQDAEGYLTVVDGVLVHTDTPAAWEYKKGSFCQTLKTKTTDNGNKKSKGKKATITYYYLTSATTVSTESVKAEIYETVLATTHTYTAFENQKDGTHKRTCTACGGVETGNCSYDEETGYCICGAYNPALSNVTIDATVNKEGKNRKKTVYRAIITTDAVGTTVKTVEYSTNGGTTWIMGSSFSSNKNIESFLVRVTDENGKVYNYTYPE